MLERIVATSFPYHYNHDLYQDYYWKSFAAFCSKNDVSFSVASDVRCATFFKALRRIRFSYKLGTIMRNPVFPAMVDRIARLASHGEATRSVPMIGAYEFRFDEFGKIQVCIDSRDTNECSLEDMNSCMLYFKTNYWRGISYPSKVAPLPNMNPLVGRNLKFLRSLRNRPFDRDLFAFIRVWGYRRGHGHRA